MLHTHLQQHFKNVFNEKRFLLRKMCSDLGLDAYVEKSTFPTFEDLVERFKTSGRRENGAQASVMEEDS